VWVWEWEWERERCGCRAWAGSEGKADRSERERHERQGRVLRAEHCPGMSFQGDGERVQSEGCEVDDGTLSGQSWAGGLEGWSVVSSQARARARAPLPAIPGVACSQP
jgi:hypothetical protein